MSDEATRVRRIRRDLLDRHPFWGHLLLQLKVALAPELPSFGATDGATTVWINPTLTRHLDDTQLGFVLMHELAHVVLDSVGRRGGRAWHRWNVATDYAINRIVARVRLYPGGPPQYRPPTGFVPGLGEVSILLDPRFDDRIAEAIYEELDEDDLRGAQRLRIALPGDVEPLPADDHGGGVDVHLPPRMDSDARAHREAAIEHALEGWRDAGGRGDLPGAVRRRSVDRIRPGVPWDRLLARALEVATGRVTFDPRRPHRRWLARGLIAPSPRGEASGHVVAALDTSASMSPDVLARVVAELRPLRDRVTRLTLIVADAEIHRVLPGDELDAFLASRRIPGGGGTDHRPVFAWLRDHAPSARLFVGLTDLFTRLPPTPPPCPVLWVAPPRHGTAPWGDLVVAETFTP